MLGDPGSNLDWGDIFRNNFFAVFLNCELASLSN